MYDVDNDIRAGWAATALDAFGAETGQVGYDYTDPDQVIEVAGDLIANLFHLARAAGLSADDLIHCALDHFLAEVPDQPDS